jgi:predicted phosphodiesterase
MRILILSDLHIEFQHDRGKSLVSKLPKEVDCVVIAGDWLVFSKPWAESCVQLFADNFKYVVSIKGNHCIYNSSPTKVDLKIADIKSRIPNWYPLDKSTVTLEGVTFAGATTWFPDTVPSRMFQPYLNDFKCIKEFVPWVYQENTRALDFWSDVEADVWISHHLPSEKCVSEYYKDDNLNCYYVEPALEGLIGYKQPKYHIFGHSHNSTRLQIGDTICLSNPYGYETYDGKDLNRDFRYDYIIEV